MQLLLIYLFLPDIITFILTLHLNVVRTFINHSFMLIVLIPALEA